MVAIQRNTPHLHKLLLLLLLYHLTLCYHGDGMTFLPFAHDPSADFVKCICDGFCGNVAAENMTFIAFGDFVAGYVSKISVRSKTKGGKM